MKFLSSAIISALLVLASFNLLAQADEHEHRFTRLGIEARGEFEFIHNNYPDTVINDYGFNGKYFNLLFGGEIGDKFSYYFRQRIIANPGSVRFFDNTDFLYMQYKFNDRWTVRCGKDALAIGGFEYDAPPIDVLYYTKFWGSIYCFQLAGSVRYTDKSGNNTLVLQVANSPYVYYMGSGNEWKQGLLSYGFLWYGDYGHFHTIYSVNAFERSRGKFIGMLSLGNKLDYDKWSCYVDYMPRFSGKSNETLFSDFSIVSRFDVKLKDVKIFAKGGYEENKTEACWTLEQKDILMTPGQSYYFYGVGVEYRPASYKNIRLHAYVANAVTTQEYGSQTNVKSYSYNNINANVGLTWDVDFLKYLRKQFNKENKQ